MDDMTSVEELETMVRLTKDLKKAAQGLTTGQARYLVDTYYQIQHFRIEADAQKRAAAEAQEPNQLVTWIGELHRRLEGSLKSALDAYSDVSSAGRWAKSITGIGPVIAAGLLAHIDPAKARTVGGLWRFAGLDPSQQWDKGEKRPWNAALKTLCWKIGESFVKCHNRPDCFYGAVYAERKALELYRNANGAFGEQAAAILQKKKFRADTKAKAAYTAGVLPDGHLHARAKRYAVKLFLSHYHHVSYESAFGTPPPKPFVIGILGHADYIAPPNWPMSDRAPAPRRVSRAALRELAGAVK